MAETASTAQWHGPGFGGQRRAFTWNRLLWALVFPQRRHRIMLTASGALLTVLAFGIGSAAYNSANNILFITLALLLACLILSGVLSWFNFARVHWRLQLTPPWRAGQAAVIGVELDNRKRFLPTYGLWFDLAARPAATQPAKAETTFTARGRDVRTALARAGLPEAGTKLHLGTRLDAQGTARVEWIFQPPRRGRWRVELAGVGSLFPFGFLSKTLGTDASHEVIVWPAPVEYRRQGATGARRNTGGEQLGRAGSGGDLLALRRYAAGDSHRLIHWKVSARLGQLLVRQFTAESSKGFTLWLQTDAAVWTRPEQFELCLSLVATLAEDLFRRGELLRVAIDDEPPLAVRSVHDLEAFFDRLAEVQPVAAGGRRPAPVQPGEGAAASLANGKRNLMTFAPDGARGVVAHVDGTQAASA
jgi:uncharacterized protein (DUF58 family)